MGGVELFNLVAKISVDSTEFKDGLQEAEDQGNSFEGAFSGIVEKLKKALTAAGIAAAVTAIANAFKQAVDMAAQYGDQVDKGSQRLGISTEAYQEWAHALEQSGADISELGIGIKNINAFLSGNAEEGLADAFAELGISAKDAEGNVKSTEEALREVILTLAGMEQDAYRGTMLTSIFGRSGQDLNAFLNTGKQGIQDLTEEAHDLGLVMTGEEIANSVAYGDAISNMNAAVDALKMSVVTGLMPALKDAAEFVTQIISFFNLRSRQDNSAEAQFERIDDAASSALVSIGTTESTANSLIDKLAAMGDATQRTAEQTAVWKGLAAELVDLVPSLAGQIDMETGSLQASTEELKANTEEWARNARQQALNNALAEKREVLAQKAQAATDAEVKAGVAEAKNAANLEKAVGLANQILQTDWISKVYGSGTVKQTGDVNQLIKDLELISNYAFKDKSTEGEAMALGMVVTEISQLQTEAEDARTKAEELQQELSDATAEYQLYAETITSMMQAAETSTGEAQSAVDSLNSSINSLPSSKDIYIKVHGLESAGIDFQYNAKGLNYVPYDNYVSRLHRGEMILNKSRADDYREGRTGSLEAMTSAITAAVRAGMQGVNYNFSLDGEKVAHNTTDRQRNDQMAWRFAVT